jgi:UDP-N-acetylmuramoyl-L-alanine---L-glutamate ligase
MYLQNLLDTKLNNGQILLLGLGQENRQCLQWLTQTIGILPSNITIADKNTIEAGDCHSITGDNYLDALNGQYDVVIKSPGIWSNQPALQAYRSKYGDDSIISSLTYFIEHFRDNIVMITGTKGKTTTSSWIKHILDSKLEQEVYYCGNTTNISPYQFWTELEEDNTNKFFVIEVSSFQLQDLGNTKLSSKYSVITNLYIDHLDQHADAEEYWQAKDNIFLQQAPKDYCVITQQVQDNLAERRVVVPSHCIVIRPQQAKDLSLGYTSTMLGEHNWSNLLLAMTICDCVSHKPVDYQGLINSFQPPQGRLELIRTMTYKKQIIRFYNDNTATEPDAVIAAIKALQAPNTSTLLILSGKVKQGNYQQLATLIKNSLKSRSIYDVKYFGPIGQLIKEHITGTQPTIKSFTSWLHHTKSLDKIISTNTTNINILFSPAGSSFDEFENYIVRGQTYIDWVNSLDQK